MLPAKFNNFFFRVKHVAAIILPHLSTDINVQFYQNLKNQLPKVTKLIDDQWLSEVKVQTDKTYVLESNLLSSVDQRALIKDWALKKAAY